MFPFESIINSLKETIILFDKKSRMVFINRSGEELLGKSSRDIVGKSLGRLFPGERKISPLIRKSISEERSFRGKSAALDLGRQISVDFSLSPFYLYDRADGAVLSMTENISIAEREDYEQEALVYMLGTIAHEIKNPLGGIKGGAQLLIARSHDRDTGEYADHIIRETDRLNSILQNYLTICRKPSFSVVNVHEVIEKALTTMSPQMSGMGISVKRFYDPSLPLLHGDGSKLLQVFLNIIKNAVESMQRKGVMEISTSPSKELFGEQGRLKRMALITIRDNGRGMTEKELQKIFLPFYTKKKSGTGLGLSLSRKIINDHGGMISVKSRKGEGSAFLIYIPFRDDR
jgi:two-component system nitrogen regulation sensor histidine kinase GlnL